VDLFFEAMKEALESVEIRGFGSFQVRSYRGYKGRHCQGDLNFSLEVQKVIGFLFP